MMFAKDASTIDKDHPRRASLRSRVSAIGAALKPKHYVQLPTAIAPSGSQSECSTLVNFAVEDVVREDHELDFETEEYMLDAENSAWANGTYSASCCYSERKRSRTSQRVLAALPETEMLGIENSAWVGGKPAGPPATSKTRTRLFSSNRPKQIASGVEPEYLDPEDRAWM